MSNMKKLFALAVAVLLVFSLGTSVLAANDGKITVANAAIGETYTIYKIFDAKLGDNGAITYTYDGTLSENDYFVQDDNGFVTATEAAVDANGDLTEGAIEFLGTLVNEAVDTKVAESATVVFDGLEYGYYYVTSSLGAVVTIDSTNKEAVVIDKNGAPSINKTVNKEEATIGETLIFTIEVPLVQYDGTKMITEYYVFDDMEDCMTYNNDLSATIKVGEGAATEFTAYDVYSDTLAEGQDFLAVIPIQSTSVVDEVTVYDGNFLYDSNAVVVFTYTATVNENVKVGEAMKNYVELNWKSITPNTPPTPPTPPAELPTEPNGEGPSDETVDFSAKIELTKVNADGDTLTGAKFSISGVSTNVSYINETIFVEDDNGEYWMLKDGKYTTTAPVTESYTVGDITYLANTDKYDSITKKYAKIDVVTKETSEVEKIVAEGYVNENGIITFTGLGEGEYTITELVAPNGYNLLVNPIIVNITFDEEDKVFTATLDGEDVDVIDGVIAFDVVNNEGSVLPGTGGIGTTIFYVLGGLLLVGAAVLLISKKLASAKK
ncbi:MAG: isopeptide-forming domain-containing fimbrial protein [Clostridia bacterium]|nr:isopeptide-forming domain-containing fimbrial protein [Clostridia bacterium]